MATSHTARPCTYRITHTATKKFFVGSTVNLKRRLYQHFRQLKRGDHPNTQFQALYNSTPDLDAFTVRVIRYYDHASELQAPHARLLQAHFNNPQCINLTRKAHSGMRGLTLNNDSKLRHSFAMMGKNTTRQRAPIVSLVSPTGEVHDNILNLSDFARQHSLRQASLSALVFGDVKSLHGWRVA